MELNKLKRISIVFSILLTLIMLSTIFSHYRNQNNPTDFLLFFLKHRYIGLLFFLFLCSATILTWAPNIPAILYAATFLNMNTYLVILTSGLGWSSGELISYYLGRAGVLDLLTSKSFKEKVDKWTSKIDQRAGLTIYFMSFFPNPFFDVISYMSGHKKIPVYKFYFFCLLGRLSASSVIVLFAQDLAKYFFK